MGSELCPALNILIVPSPNPQAIELPMTTELITGIPSLYCFPLF